MNRSDSSALVQLADEIAERYRRGEQPSPEDYVGQYPHLEQRLRDLFPALAAMEKFGSVSGAATGPYAHQPEAAAPERLGEYRILREVARGGMGVVYEAVQESLGRHVALKVLPAHWRLSATHLQRFQREAKAAAKLHHTHIVPVFGVGADQGVHYYAMQFIQGQSLDSVLYELQRLRAQGRASSAPVERSEFASTDEAEAVDNRTTLAAEAQGGAGLVAAKEAPGNRASARAGAPVNGQAKAGSSGSHSGGASATGVVLEHKTKSDTRYYRAVAQLGIQVAEALAYAHEQGVLHRDIKPANLLLDTHGTVWITDFGLAKSAGSDELTSVGDIVGTLRYMAPERFHGHADPRSDIYSLGLTLYELLTLRPAFAATDRVKLMERVLHETPTAPRLCDPQLPRDLEVIVLKASAKTPDDRYTGALELADDLRRFLEDRPILAKRPTLFQRVKKWARRHQAVVRTAASAFVLSVAALGAMAGWMLHDRDERQRKAAAEIDREIRAREEETNERRRRAGGEIERAVHEARRLQKQRRWPDALAYAEHAEDILDRVDGQEAWRPAVAELLKDLRMLGKLEELGLRRDDVVRVRGLTADVGLKRPADHYGPLLRDYGIDILASPVEEAALEIKGRSIAEPLIAGLDAWARMEPDQALRKRLRAIIRLVEPEGVLARWREALAKDDQDKMREIVVGLEPAGVSPIVLSAIGRAAFEEGLERESLNMLGAAHLAYPEEFAINAQLGFLHTRLAPPQWDESARFCTAAVAIRPGSAQAWLNLGNVLHAQGKADSALAALTRAVELKLDLGGAQNNLAVNLKKRGKLKEAEAAFRLAVLHLPTPFVYDNFAWLLVKDPARHEEAEQLFNKALELDPGFASAFTGRGLIRARKGDHEAAMTDFRAALDLDPDDSDAHIGLGSVLRQKKEFPAALKSLEEAIRLEADNLEAHYQMGLAYFDSGKDDKARGAVAQAWEKFDRAIDKFKHIVAQNKDDDSAWIALGNASRERGFMKAAMAAFERAVEIKPKDATALYHLARIHGDFGDYAKAAEIYERARAADPDFIAVYANHGGVLLDLGKFTEAEKLLRAGLERKYDPKGAREAILNLAMALDRQARYGEAIALIKDGRAKLAKDRKAVAEIDDFITLYGRLAQLEKKLPAILKGEVRPADRREALQLAEVCMARKRYAAAVLLFEEAFARFPEAETNLADANRFDAARAAACAGCGLDTEADAAKQAAWRTQVLAWLRADLLLWIGHAEKVGSNPGTTQALERWRHHLHFAGVRDPESLARLPQVERIKWTIFWADVAAVLERFPVP